MKVYKSIKDCHAIGVNSIVLEQNDKKLIRVFYTKPHHVIWKNKDPFSKELAIAFHSHHCDISIEVVYGIMTNITATVKKEISSSNICGWKFQSAIKNTNGSFEKSNNFTLESIEEETIGPKKLIVMPANKLHTVYVEQDKEAAWIIREGNEDPNYDNTCYSNSDLTNFNFNEHYKTMTEEEVCVIENICKNYLKES